MAFTEEEANAELEKLQQNITLTLQAIDQNFAKCNQIVSAELLPIVDKFAEASRGVWDGSKLWLYFFQSLEHGMTSVQVQENNGASNRPPLGAASGSARKRRIAKGRSPWQRLNQELSIEASSDTSSVTSHNKAMTTPSQATEAHPLGRMLQRQYHQHVHPTIQSAYLTSTTTSLPKPSVTALSESTIESITSQQRFRSPPRTIGFGPSPTKLLRTPVREAAQIMVEDFLDTTGARSPPSSSSPKEKEPWIGAPTEEDDMDRMDEDDEISRKKVKAFLEDRERGPDGGMVRLPSWRPRIHSPDPRSRQREDDWKRQAMVSTPTMEHVMGRYRDDLRPSTKRSRDERDEEEETEPGRIEQDTHLRSFSVPMTPHRDEPGLLPEEDHEGAYEFSNTLPIHNPVQTNGETASMGSGETASSMMTMMSGLTGQVPARFSLHYFPRSFQTPPGSTQLTRIYSLFSDRPGQMLTTDDVLQKVQDATQFYNADNVKLLIDLLVRKQFLKPVNSGWTLRR